MNAEAMLERIHAASSAIAEWLSNPDNSGATAVGFLSGLWTGAEVLKERYEDKLEAKYGDDWAEASASIPVSEVQSPQEIIGIGGGITLGMTVACVASVQFYRRISRNIGQRRQA